MGKIMLRMGKKFGYHVEIVWVNCRNFLKIGIRQGAMKMLGTTFCVKLLTHLPGANELNNRHPYQPKLAVTKPQWVNRMAMQVWMASFP